MIIKETFCLWCDLLGYGQPFIDSGWDLKNEIVEKNIKRINDLKEVFKSVNNHRIERTLIINDGFIKNMDVFELNKSQEYLYWFNQMLNNFDILNKVDKYNGFPGARAVITYGHRFDYMNNEVKYKDIQMIVNKDNTKKNNTIIYSPKEFQMNTAFSKAYLIESAGSKKGISGPNLYIDIEFLEKLKNIIEKTKYEDVLIKQENMKKVKTDKMEVFYTKKEKLNLKVEIIEEEKFTIWQVKRKIYDKENIWFKLWLDKKYICFKEKGINTKLYKALKYKPFDEEDFIINLVEKI